MVASPGSSSPRPRVDYVGLSVGSVVVVVGAVLAAWLLRGVFVAAHRTLGWVVACAVVALLIDPAVTYLSRWLPRVLAVIVVLLLMLGLFGAVGFGVAREVTDSLDDLVAEAPRAAAELEQRYDWAADVGVADRVESFVGDLDERVRQRAVSEAAGTAPTYVVTGILMLFFLGGGRRYVDGFLEQLSQPRRNRWRRIISRAAVNGREWMLGSIAIGIVVGLAVGIAAWIAALPATVSLGAVAGVLAVTPFVGVILGGLPLILLGFGFQGWPTGVAMAILLVALQLADALVARPWLERRSVRVGVTVPILFALVGFEIYDGGGAVYAVALAVLGLAALAAAGFRVDDPEPAVPG